MSNWELRGRFASTVRNWMEDGLFWLKASPNPLNKLDSSNVERFYETGSDLIETIVGAIERKQHVALAGPRGCGKSYCVGQAANIAQQRGLIPPSGIIKIQGNKELPRDYLIEDDLALEVRSGVVLPKPKYAPLFSRARRDPGTGRPIVINGRVEIEGDGANGLMKPGQTLVLFLDEVNRFSDGVLDSLLLLLEEGEAIMGGDTYQLPVVVLMTMNPPGYDSSARNLSPPLSARIGRQYRLLSPQLDVLTDTIAPSAIARATTTKPVSAEPVSEVPDGEAAVGEVAASDAAATQLGPVRTPNVLPPSPRTLRRAAAATLCCWGNPATEKPSFEYLSEDMRRLLSGLARSDPALEAAMTTLSDLCHYGPDARALIDWIKAASVVARNEAMALWQRSIQVQGRHFIDSAITVISHKVQDSFSSASQPGNTRRKEEAIHVIVRTLMHGSPEIDALLRRRLDDDELLLPAAKTIWTGGRAGQLRQEMIDHKVVEDAAVEQWCAFIQSLPDLATKPDIRSSIEKDLDDKRILEPLDSQTKAFSSKNHKEFTTWLAGQRFTAIPQAQRRALLAALKEVAQRPAYDRTLGDYFDRLRCVQDKVWPNGEALMALISEASELARRRQPFQTVAECIDLFWVRAEHYGTNVVNDIKRRLDELNLHHTTRTSVDMVIYAAASTIAEHPARGRNTRAALRALTHK
ncbi:ATP-binding protein [Sinorhizobium sp. CCBAU 05631]|uniref:ATP-binding protein n=1 Tax=Sinorhizobium sp. CCBAU 05631 TaxID=794846 RepID=UPI0004B8B982|nr:ATP-binding protein [Sinorhizobium sp. CCBAU 05631]ASY61393.1 hypothetical protein SS05631_d64920 [Sinorhizobium sp. CCBAU 05631]